MAITRKKEDSLVETGLKGKKLDDVKSTGKEEKNGDSPEPKPKDSLKGSLKKKKVAGFLSTTIEELKKVQWPTFNYTIKTTVIIIIFTLVFSSALGLFEHGMTSGVKFVACTTPEGSNQPIEECLDQFKDQLLFQTDE
jgi:preprotein translocase SecE subunit